MRILLALFLLVAAMPASAATWQGRSVTYKFVATLTEFTVSYWDDTDDSYPWVQYTPDETFVSNFDLLNEWLAHPVSKNVFTFYQKSQEAPEHLGVRCKGLIWCGASVYGALGSGRYLSYECCDFYYIDFLTGVASLGSEASIVFSDRTFSELAVNDWDITWTLSKVRISAMPVPASGVMLAGALGLLMLGGRRTGDGRAEPRSRG